MLVPLTRSSLLRSCIERFLFIFANECSNLPDFVLFLGTAEISIPDHREYGKHSFYVDSTQSVDVLTKGQPPKPRA